ncbi:ABC transporter ATP-binding protein [Solirubrobacter sp. CPCC 204708]|uniref:ABC transporter ATP-binding protein/permease n=1 Tax=Solirubrobacter deserti TaxID=2282478 RepID=A0ABT4RLU2_9ACTN|nr:ABC transporter ATP-binding protein [Solirubrobacter deserti]MBE2316758.1 ABC transporter ATP-binding protein [Solirubrobacter deserti]MDA0139514.1 ABC transporter ATP-binding protein/permease [Solirubrobacter deserti]
MKVLWSFARPHARTLALGLLLALLGSATGLATPLVTKWVLDSLGSGDSLLAPAGVLLALTLGGSLVFLLQWRILGAMGERVVLGARTSMIRRYLRATVPGLTARPSGELVTRVTSDTVLLSEAAASAIVGIINSTVMLVGTLVLMGVLDLVLLGVTIVAVVIVTLLFALVMPAIAKAKTEAQEHLGQLGGALEGALRAIKTVKANRAEDRLQEQIVASAATSAEYSIRAARKEGLAWTIAWTGVQLAIIVVLALGAWRVQDGLLEVSSLIAFLLYAFNLMGPIMELSQQVTQLQTGLVAAGRIREMDAIEIEPELAPTSAPEQRDGPILALHDVVAAYGPDTEPAVDGVSLTVPRRGHVAIVGPSGAGKTSLFSLILRFLEPQSGRLELDGRDYAGWSHAEVRDRLAYVEQETPVVPGTILDNVLLGRPDATREEVEAVMAQVRLEHLDLDESLSGTNVSGGERQRIAVARAMLRAPDVLLLDEATAQVDALTESAIGEAIQTRAQQGAVLTIAHRLSTVIDADTIIVLEDGRVRAQGTHTELLQSDELYRSFVEALRIDQSSYGKSVMIS